MNKITLFGVVILVVSLSSCGNNNTSPGEDKPKQFPTPGTIIAQAEMPVTMDTLNHFTFSVKVIADSDVKSGVYDIDADFGPNFAEGQMVMPKGGEHLAPAIRKDTAPYTFIIGFKMEDDTTFYDYYEVKSSLKQTKMRYIKAYSF